MAKPFTTEKQLYNYLKSLFPYGHWQRIETPVGTGIPDVNCCINGTESWLELKIGSTKHDRKTGKLMVSIHMRRDQRSWLRKRDKAGGRCFVVVGVARLPIFLTIHQAMLMDDNWVEFDSVLAMCFKTSEALRGAA